MLGACPLSFPGFIEDLSALPDRRNRPRLADCLVRGDKGQVMDQCGRADDAVGRIFGIPGWQSVSLDGNIGCDWKNGEAALNFGKNRLRVRLQRKLSAACKTGDFDQGDAGDCQSAVFLASVFDG
jgi:hypothetical protein